MPRWASHPPIRMIASAITAFVLAASGLAILVAPPASATGEDHLAFTMQPSNTQAGQAMSDVVVQVQDVGNSAVVGNSDNMKLTLNHGQFEDTTTSVTVAAVDGVATFSGLKIDQAGNYTLTAHDVGTPSLSDVPSDPFTISPDVASKLAFTRQPTNTYAGQLIDDVALDGAGGMPVTVEIQDQFGNVETSRGLTERVYRRQHHGRASSQRSRVFREPPARHGRYW